MTSRPDLHEDMPSPADEAAAWFGRKRVVGLGEAEQHEFEAWLSQDPAHLEAFEALERTWFGVEAMRDDPRLLALREQALRRNTRLRRFFAPAALAAGLLIAVGGGWFAVTSGDQFQTQAFRTSVGERSTVTLPDGSTVTLDTDTVVRTEAVKGRRQVYLDRGQAFFQVAKDASRPFVVNAGGRTVTALGTAFEVRVDAGRFEVTLVEGKVRVEAPVPAQAPSASPTAAAPPTRLQATEMVAGTQLLASDDRAWQLQEINAQRETSWTRGQLVFFTEPLSEVVAELNRYSQTKIVLADPALADIPITGTFKPGDNKSFAAAVVSYGMASAAPQPDGTIRLVAPASGGF